MKQKVWKFSIHVKDGLTEHITVPAGTQFLSAGMQGGNVVLWGLCPQIDLRENREILVVGTGWEMPETGELKFIDTVQAANGLVWHVFEVGGF